ncbi:hypothetical protein A8E43_03275, partial [Burkholderia cenocepacia]
MQRREFASCSVAPVWLNVCLSSTGQVLSHPSTRSRAMVSSSVLSNHVDVPVANGSQVVASPGGPANFLLSAHKEDVANYARSGNDLVVEFKDGRTVRVQAFFENGADYHNLVFVQDDGRFLVQFGPALQATGDGIVDAALTYAPIGDGLSTGALLGILGGVADRRIS